MTGRHLFWVVSLLTVFRFGPVLLAQDADSPRPAGAAKTVIPLHPVSAGQPDPDAVTKHMAIEPASAGSSSNLDNTAKVAEPGPPPGNPKLNLPQSQPPDNAPIGSRLMTGQVQQFSTQLAPPQDIASLNAKEILGQNSQAISTVATMYQHFGLFITMIVGIVGAIAVWLGYQSRQNVQEFVKQWDERLAKVEADLKLTVRSANDAVVNANQVIGQANEATVRAASSAADATARAIEIKDHQRILDKALSDLMHVQAQVSFINNRLSQQGAEDFAEQSQKVAGEGLAMVAPDDAQITPSETEQLSAKLKGRLPNPTSVSTS